MEELTNDEDLLMAHRLDGGRIHGYQLALQGVADVAAPFVIDALAVRPWQMILQHERHRECILPGHNVAHGPGVNWDPVIIEDCRAAVVDSDVPRSVVMMVTLPSLLIKVIITIPFTVTFTVTVIIMSSMMSSMVPSMMSSSMTFLAFVLVHIILSSTLNPEGMFMASDVEGDLAAGVRLDQVQINRPCNRVPGVIKRLIRLDEDPSEFTARVWMSVSHDLKLLNF